MPYPGIPKEKERDMESCVLKLIDSKDFGKDLKDDERKSSAIAICHSRIMGKMADEKLEEKVNSILNKTTGEYKMENKEVTIAKFTDSAVVAKVNEIIAKLEKAEKIEDVKALIPDLKALVEEDKKEDKEEEKPAEMPMDPMMKSEPEKQLEKVVTEATKEVKVEAPKVEEKKEEVKASAEPTKTQPSSFSEVLELNDQLISKLKEASTEISKLETDIATYKKEIDSLNGKISEFAAKEKAELEQKRVAKFNDVFSKYVQFFKIEEKDFDVIKGQMSTFSEDVLEQMNKHIENKKMSEMKSEPEVVTHPSSELGVNEQPKPVIHWNELDAKAKTKFFFEKIKELENKQ